MYFIKKMQNNDQEQSLVRLFLALSVFVYIVVMRGVVASDGFSDHIYYTSLVYLVLSITAITYHFSVKTPSNVLRGVFVALDVGMITYSLSSFGYAASPFVGGYIWVSIANGIRFNRRYLFGTTILSLLGFAFVIATNDYWKGNLYLSVGLMTWIALLPAYVSVLLKKLEQAVVDANTASKTKSQFLANMSHELRTPLNSIIGYSEIIDEELSEEGVLAHQSDLAKIKSSANHLLQIINEILDLSKIEAGRIELFKEIFSVSELIAEAVASTRPIIDKNGNQLIWGRGEDDFNVYADRTRLHQVVLNLISNAAKFTSNGTIRIACSSYMDKGLKRLELSISDTGIGIPQDKISQLFHPFSQADESTTRKYGGTGLGLTISKRFINMLGGDLSVVSEEKKGSTFTIVLPCGLPGSESIPNPSRVHESASIPATSDALHARKTTGSDDRRGYVSKILVIDDDRNAREIISRHLHKDGFNVRAASNGLDGIKMARADKPDLITLDIMMPEMDGWGVLKILKADKHLSDIPVVMISMVDKTATGILLGAADFITKPIKLDAFEKTIKKWIRKFDKTKILIVDPDPDIRMAIKLAVNDEFIILREASDAEEALNIIRDDMPAVILVDVAMPDFSGRDLIRQINAMENFDEVAVIAITSIDSTSEQHINLPENVTRILDKNTNSGDELLYSIRDAIAKIIDANKRRGR